LLFYRQKNVNTNRPSIASFSLDQLRAALVAAGQRPFVAKQIFEAVYARNVRSFDEMTNLSAALRRDLAARFCLRTLELVGKFDSPDGSFKLALRLADGQTIESAFLATGDHGTVCVSSQVGCAMGCLFCASGEKGLVRNLAAFEMVEQVLAARDHLPPGRRLSHVTFMGIGEPLANFDHLTRALDLIHAPEGLNIGARRLSISTCGTPAGISRLADLGRQYHLAISLHAPNDALRRQLMPTAARVPIAEIMLAAEDYCRRTTRKIVFEYVLIRGLNDQPAHARELAALVGGFPSMVNLIPMNPVAACPDLEPSTPAAVEHFRAALEKSGVEVCVRRRKGAEVDAACGQLRARLDAAEEE
jgi:23S rRNA (adenine2503-C2)-methyltransferase